MKKEIHPKSNQHKVVCTTCEKEFEVASVANEVKIDICSNCHPFYTGKQSSGTKAGRIDKFNKKLDKSDKNKK